MNLRAPQVLAGLCYRALAGEADPAQAPLTGRKLTHLQAGDTELLKTISSLRVDVQIAGARALELRHDAYQAALDFGLFSGQHPEQKGRRGLWKPRLKPEERNIETKRTNLATLAARSQAKADEAAALSEALKKKLASSETERDKAQARRDVLMHGLQVQLAAGVLNLVAANDIDQARYLLEESRKQMRGDLMVAMLFVLVALFAEGVDEALIMLGELRTIFHQHDTPVSQVLAALIGYVRGRRLDSRETSTLALQLGDAPSYSHLAMLICALDGWPYQAGLAIDDPFFPTLKAVYTLARMAEPPAAWSPPTASDVENWISPGDLIVRTMGANILLQLGAIEIIPRVAGVDVSEIEPPRRKQKWPALLELLGSDPIAAWPAELGEPWRVFLACHVLLAARGLAPPELFESWLAESYNWPKSDFYWWTLSRVQDDPALLHNISGDSGQLASGVPV